VIWTVQNGYLDQVPVEQVKEFQTSLTDFLTTRRTALLGRIEKEKSLNDELRAELKSAAEEFGQAWLASSGTKAR
jgi:F-type H+-transporting ATPase subunit alpha